ncbi:hypothetical protein KFK09_001727 [Dendrobium nobile]|uniref:DUF4283 domain-containing protein n=1 Tax=Dendrobium nobile TaxID=94219 RepID=A0A8T3C5S4_DENNO|nr:hypothetical protein KFK09_001727 [Dendrobium nobile]
METSHLDSDFPPLSSSGAVAPASLRNWNQIFASDTSSVSKVFSFSHHPSEPDIIPFSNEKLTKGGEDWNLCLVGYSIGRRPYYEALLGAINKTWSLKGSLQLLSLSDGLFLLRFSCVEDFDMAWSKGVWFLLGKPFVLQKWHPKFKPKRENFSSVPIWVKIHDLPLACWNSEGISRITSKIGVPLAPDHLTEQKTRLTFSQVCVLVDCNATYPDVIKVSLDGDVVELKVQYEWRPVPCEHCKSLAHYSASCPTNPPSLGTDSRPIFLNYRGRSSSKKPSNHIPSRPPSSSRPIIHAPSLHDPFFDSSHLLFSNEASVHNFNFSSSGRIWIKWDANKLNFTPTLITLQMINGTVTIGNLLPFQISIVYAYNNA